MKRIPVLLISLILVLLLASQVLASDISGALYRMVINISNTGDAATMVSTTVDISSPNLIAGGFANAAMDNIAMRNAADQDAAFMPGYDTNPWCIFVPSIGTGTYTNYRLYTAECTNGKLVYFPDGDGMSIADDASMEPVGDEFNFLTSCYLGTSTAQVGDLMILVFVTDSTTSITFPVGWTTLFEDTAGGAVRFKGAYHVLDGNEDACITVVTGANESTAYIGYLITDYEGTPEASMSSGNNDSPDPPNHNNSWGSAQTLYIAVEGHDSSVTILTYPTDYTDGQESISTQSGCGSAVYDTVDSSENPGSFEITGGQEWVAATIAIKGATTDSIIRTRKGQIEGETDHDVELPFARIMRKKNTITCVRTIGEVGASILHYPAVSVGLPITAGEHTISLWRDNDYLTETLRPNAVGDETNITYQYPASGAHWDKVDEETSDGNTTFVGEPTGPAWFRDLYNLPASTGSGDIKYIKVTARFQISDGSKTKIAIKSGVTVAESGEFIFGVPPPGYSSSSYTWTDNPDDALPWEWSDIDNLQIGISLYNAGVTEPRCTQLYVEVYQEVFGMTIDDGLPGEATGYVPFSDDLTDNNEPWIIGNTSTPYIIYYSHTVDGDLMSYIEWEYGTTFYDQSDNGVHDNDATPSFRTTGSHEDVTAEPVSFEPIEEAKAPPFVLDETPDWVEAPEIPGEFTTTPEPTFPGSEVVTALSEASGTPAQLPFTIIAGFITLAVSLIYSGLLRRGFSGSLIIKGLLIGCCMGIAVATGINDFWMLLFFAILTTAMAMASQQRSWS